MMASTLFIFFTLFAIGYTSTIPESPKTDPAPSTFDVPSSTGRPERTTRGPHTHDEHPVDDPNHSDHDHPEESVAIKSAEEDHEHPGHDHSETGHDHSLDHLEEEAKNVEEAVGTSSDEVSKKDQDSVKGDQEESEKRSKRGLWRRRLD